MQLVISIGITGILHRYDGFIIENCYVYGVSRWGIAVGYTSQIIKTEGAIYASKVQLVCPKCDTGVRTKVGYKTVGDKQVKVRLCAKCGAEI